MILRIISVVSVIISSVSGIIGIFIVPYERYTLAGVLGVLFSICLILFFICRALISNMSSHWIDDRLNERIWTESGKMYHFIQMNSAGGINYNAFGKGFFYSDYRTKSIKHQWNLKSGFVGIFYDYTEPSLYEYLKSVGVAFKEETIRFKIRDARI